MIMHTSSGRVATVVGLVLLVAACSEGAKSPATPNRADETGGKSVSSPDEPPAKPALPATTTAAVIAPSVSPPPLPQLEVMGKKLTDAELEQMIVDGKVTSDIVEVVLSSNRLTARALELLAASPIERLQRLDIYDNPIGDVGAKVIAREPFYRGVNRLSLGYTGMTLAGVKALIARDSILTGLIRLQLNGIPIGDEGLDVILASRFAEHLLSLNLSNTGITDAGATRLVESKALPNLSYLDVSRNQLGPEIIARLRKLKMDLRVQTD